MAATGWDAAQLIAASIELADPGRMTRLVARWPTADVFTSAAVDEVSAGLRLGPQQAASLASRVSCADEVLVRDLERQGIAVVALGEKGYPPLLATTPQAPPLLFVRGCADVLTGRAIAIVGSRKSTAYGRAVAEAVAERAAVAGLSVVSGGAMGIDSAAHGAAAGRGTAAAHGAAAASKGATVAVLGCGVDIAYPPRNRALFDRIRESGALISEFPPGMEPRAYHFPLRNRVIAGMAECVVIVEAAAKSGALITAGFAADLGRDVFAVPAQIWATQSIGCLELLRDGAAPLIDPGDPVARYGLESPRLCALALSDLERSVLESIRSGLDTLDALVDGAGGTAAGEHLQAVTSLELAGMIKRDNGGKLTVCRG